MTFQRMYNLTKYCHEIEITMQRSKLRVHPAPGVHILAAGCMDFKPCAPGMYISVFNIINTLIQKCTYEKIAGCMVLSSCVPGVCME